MTGHSDDELLRRARTWLDDDPDEADRAELAGLVAPAERGDADALGELRARFAAPLTFGTAGLRGPMQPGPAGMNTAVLRRTSAGLAAWLRQACGASGRVVIGWDGRHRSAALADDAARVLAGAGLEAVLLPEALPTPVLAFAVRYLAADAGVMMTASHNPAGDNGYKVYLGARAAGGDPAAAGAQLVAPADAEIEAAAQSTGPARLVTLGASPVRLGQEIVDEYVQAVVRLLTTDPAAPARAVRVAYTPLHGVGLRVLQQTFAAAGFPAPVVVAQQANPDPDFPTVRYPNPEEPGACDLLLALAADTGADVALANDPDADRLAAAVRGRLLTGDELGLLLADHVLRSRPGPVATSLVSSSALARLADARGVPCTTTLTGFKWIMRASPDLVFGYEEALGYAAGPRVVRDKDGISAALLLAEAAAAERRVGRTLLDRLDDLAREIGLSLTRPVTVRLANAGHAPAILQQLRADPPATLAGRAVELVDLRTGWNGLPPTDGVVLRSDDVRAVVRPSGTEAKLKAYLEATATAADTGQDLAGTRTRLDAVLEEVQAELTPRLAPPA